MTLRRRSTAVESREFWQRIGFTLGALVIYRLGTYLPLPGLDVQLLQEIYGRDPGALGHISILALNIMPYITASIWLLLLTEVWQRLRKRHTGGNGLDRFARVGAVMFAALEAYGFALALEGGGTGGRPLVTDPGLFFELTTVTTLTGGTVFVMWLADQITRRGIGNGIGLVFFSGIVGRLPAALVDLLDLRRFGAFPTPLFVLLMALAIGTIALIVFMESAQRRILVQYRPRLVGTMMFEGEGAYLSVKPNSFGIIPVIFASSFLLVPASLAGYSADQTGWLEQIVVYLRHGQPAYLAYYAGLIALFAFLYTALLVNPRAMAEKLRGYGGTIAGYEPGGATARHLAYVRDRLTLVGSVYVAGVCLLPEILVSRYNVPFYFGGSTLLIAVCVALDLLGQIRAHVDPRG